MKRDMSIEKGNVFAAFILGLVCGLAVLTMTILMVPKYQQLLEMWMSGATWNHAATASVFLLAVYGSIAYVFSIAFQAFNKRVVEYFYKKK